MSKYDLGRRPMFSMTSMLTCISL